MGHVYHIRLRVLAHRVQVEWNNCPHGWTITAKVKIDAVRLGMFGSHTDDTRVRGGR